MNTYNVYLPPNCNTEQDISKVKFLTDGKSLFAIIAPPLWLAWHRMWWGLGVYVALVVLLAMMYFTGLHETSLYLSAIPGLFLMLEGNELIRQRHERQGWQFLGVIHGRNLEEAELRFFDVEFLDNMSVTPAPIASPGKPMAHKQITQKQSIGLFPLEN